MNETNRKFFDFINRFFHGLSVNGNKKYNDADMDLFVKELHSLVTDNSIDQSKFLSFFTFDQQISDKRYRPIAQNFNKPYDFVFSGCSQTNGYYITEPQVKGEDHKNIWGFQIADHYNKEALNLGMGGYGAEAILKGLMHHFQKNGNPKVLLVLYPDLGRMESVDSNKTKMPTPLNNIELIQHWFLSALDDQNVDRISTTPHDPRSVVPFTQALYKNLQSIIILNEYCNKNKIYFKYSSWHHITNAFLKMLKENFPEYKNYSEPDNFNFDEKTFKNLACHKEIKENKISTIWNVGCDKEHVGIHQHIHIAEQFKREIDNDNPWS